MGRPPAIPDDDLRRRMFAAAEEMLDESGGFSLSTENVQLEAVMRRANVSRSAVYRLWPTKDDFTFDLLKNAATVTEGDGPAVGGVTAFGERGRERAREIFAEHGELLGTAAGRREALAAAIREIARGNFHEIIAERRWRRYPALVISADALDAERADAVLERIRETETAIHAESEKFYAETFVSLGLRAKPPFTDETAPAALTRMSIALFEGLALQHTVNPATADTPHPPGAAPDDAWILPAAGFLALVDGVCEPIPDE